MQRFINPKDPHNFQTIAWIEKQTRLLLQTEDGTISVEELSCNDSSCLHATTILRWTNESEIRYYKIPKPLVFIQKRDIESSLKQYVLLKPQHLHL